jgi:TRAP transporter T-component
MRKVVFGVLACVPLLSGCIESMLTNGTIKSTREASVVFDQMGDYELAKTAAQAGMVQNEGFHKLAPDNEDALFMLVQGWGGYAWGFCEDDMEIARDQGDDDAADYHKKRAKLAYDRAIFYGLELLSHKDKGFEQAKRDDHTMEEWLKKFDDKEDAANLFWVAYAWMSRVNLLQDDPAMVADLFIGVDMMERSFALDPDYYFSSAMVALGAYHGRTADAEVADAKKLFDTALQKTQHKSLAVQLTYAQMACILGDRALFDQNIKEVLNAEDPDPAQRMNNTLAKRRAKRYSSKQRMMDCGFDMSR